MTKMIRQLFGRKIVLNIDKQIGWTLKKRKKTSWVVSVFIFENLLKIYIFSSTNKMSLYPITCDKILSIPSKIDNKLIERRKNLKENAFQVWQMVTCEKFTNFLVIIFPNILYQKL